MKYEVKEYEPATGRFIKENGEVVNIADIIGGKSTGEKRDIEKYTPATGRYIKENGDVINIADAIEEFVNSGGGGSAKYTPPNQIQHGTDETTLEIQPGEMHIWGEVPELNITLKTPDKTEVVNEYMFEFISGATATHLTLPDSVKGVPIIEPNSIYQISIINNLIAYGRWGIDVA